MHISDFTADISRDGRRSSRNPMERALHRHNTEGPPLVPTAQKHNPWAARGHAARASGEELDDAAAEAESLEHDDASGDASVRSGDDPAAPISSTASPAMDVAAAVGAGVECVGGSGEGLDDGSGSSAEAAAHSHTRFAAVVDSMDSAVLTFTDTMRHLHLPPKPHWLDPEDMSTEGRTKRYACYAVLPVALLAMAALVVVVALERENVILSPCHYGGCDDTVPFNTTKVFGHVRQTTNFTCV